MKIRIGFHDAPPIYSNSQSFYSRLVEVATGEPVEVVSEKPHIVFQSVHPSNSSRAKRLAQDLLLSTLGTHGRPISRRRAVEAKPALPGGKTIWFTGENIRPPAGDWGATFSFDLDDLGGTNVYLPLWWENVGLLGAPSTYFTGLNLDVKALTQKRDSDILERSQFTCAFIGNPTRMRHHAINALSELGQVDIFGASVGRPVKRQFEIASRYRYMLCFENDLYPGYVTEKPLDAWANGCVPLWWGCDPARLLNPEALFNAADLGIMGMLDAIADLESNPRALKDTADQPILTRTPDLEDALGTIRRVLA